MIYIPLASKDIYYNFALEYFLADQKQFQEPVFLLWSTTPTVMLGKYQDALAELNLQYVQQHQLNVVRRYSGGGTIYTDEGGCQFSFIQPQQDKTINFDAYIETIQQALLNMNILATKTSRNDLTIDHKKISGNAQYNRNGYTVHHGSLLFDTDLAQMYDALHVDDLKLRSKHIASIRQRTMNLKALRPDLTSATFQETLIKNILNEFTAYRVYEPTLEEQAIIQTLALKFFKEPQFIFGKTPKTQLSKKQYFKNGGLVKFDISVEHGILKELRLTGDFFSNLDTKTLEKQLIGRPFRPSELELPIKQILTAQPILGITTDDLLTVLFS